MKKANIFRHVFVYVLIAFAVVIFAATLLKPAPEGFQPSQPSAETDTNPWETGGGWAFCAPPILVVVALMVSTYIQQRKLVQRIEQMQLKEMPRQQMDIPEASQPVVDVLLERGFTRIDDMIYIPAGNQPTSGLPTYVGPGEQSLAVVSTPSHLSKPNLTLETLYADGAVLHTYCPYGVTSKSAGHEASRQTRGTAKAVEYHLRRLQEFGQKHGPIYARGTPEDRSAWVTALGMPLSSPLNAWFHSIGILLLPILVLLVVLSLAANTSIFGDTLQPYFFYGSCFLMPGWLIYNVIIGRIALR